MNGSRRSFNFDFVGKNCFFFNAYRFIIAFLFLFIFYLYCSSRYIINIFWPSFRSSSVPTVRAYNYTLSSTATPARTHFEGFCRVFRLNVQTYVGPLCLILYTGHSYMFRKSCLSLMMAFTCITGITGNSSLRVDSTMQPIVKSQRAPSSNSPLIMAPSLGATLNGQERSNVIFYRQPHCVQFKQLD